MGVTIRSPSQPWAPSEPVRTLPPYGPGSWLSSPCRGTGEGLGGAKPWHKTNKIEKIMWKGWGWWGNYGKNPDKIMENSLNSIFHDVIWMKKMVHKTIRMTMLMGNYDVNRGMFCATSRRSSSVTIPPAFMHKVSPCSGCFLRMASAALTPAPNECPFSRIDVVKPKSLEGHDSVEVAGPKFDSPELANYLVSLHKENTQLKPQVLTLEWNSVPKKYHSFWRQSDRELFRQNTPAAQAAQAALAETRLSCTVWSRRTSRWTERRPGRGHGQYGQYGQCHGVYHPWLGMVNIAPRWWWLDGANGIVSHITPKKHTSYRIMSWLQVLWKCLSFLVSNFTHLEASWGVIFQVPCAFPTVRLGFARCGTQQRATKIGMKITTDM